MKRDDDFIRAMLLKIEASNEHHFVLKRTLSKTDEEKKREYHLEILSDKGFVHFDRDVFRLTSAGHDFLDAVRDDSIWKKTKETIKSSGGNATIEIVKSLALGFLKEKISKHSGIAL